MMICIFSLMMVSSSRLNNQLSKLKGGNDV